MSKKRTVHGWFLGVADGKPKCDLMEVEDELQTYYDLLDCDLIDIASVKIEGKRFEVVCDDEGKLKDDPQLSFMSAEGRYTICGNIFVCAVQSDGELRSLTESEVNIVRSRIMIDLFTARYVLIGDKL